MGTSSLRVAYAGKRTYDLGMVEDETLEREFAAAAGTLNVANAQFVEVVERVLAAGEWQGVGIHSPAQWVAWKGGLSMGHAREIVRIASRRAEFPTITAAFDRGELAVDQVAAVVEGAPAWADPILLDFAQAATVRQLRTEIREKNFEPERGTEPEPAREPRDRLTTKHLEGGRWRINGELSTELGAIIDSALTEAKDALFEAGDTDATLADALVEACQRSIDAIPSQSRRDRYRTWIHLDANADATLTAGWRIPQNLAEQILCDGVVQPVWYDQGFPVNVGRAQRIVPERTRRIVMRRDKGCRVPGCSHDRFVECHHIIEWSKGGTTDTCNLISLCPKHHRMYHQGKLGITGNADIEQGVTFTDYKGRALGAHGQPKPPDDPLPKPTGTWQHPEGGRLNRNWTGLGWIHPNELQRRREIARNR
jgi:hypothetical protein